MPCAVVRGGYFAATKNAYNYPSASEATLKNMRSSESINTLRPRQNDRHFPDDIFKWIFVNENVWILIQISLKFVPICPINNIQALSQIMAWCRPGDKPLSEPTMASLMKHICVTRPQWVHDIEQNKAQKMCIFHSYTGILCSMCQFMAAMIDGVDRAVYCECVLSEWCDMALSRTPWEHWTTMATGNDPTLRSVYIYKQPFTVWM